MNSSRRKLAAILEALGVPPSARRTAATPASPACESLEGRQLLTAGMTGLGLPGSGVADVSGPGYGFDATGSVATTNLHGMIAGAPTPSASTAMPTLLGGPVGQGATTAGLGSLRVPGAASTPLATDLEKLDADAQAIRDKSLVTPAMQHTVTSDIDAIKSAETTTANPAATAILRGETQLAEANPGGPTDFQAAMVNIAQEVVYTSQGVGASLIAQLNADETAIQAASGVTAADEATLAADKAAVQADQATATATATPAAAATTTATAPTTATASTPAMGTNVAQPTTPGTSSFTPGSGGFAGQGDLPGAWQAAGVGIFATSPMGGAGMTSPIGLAGGGQPGATSGGSATSTDSTILTADRTALQQAQASLQTDSAAVHDKSQVTPAMEAVVRNDLEAVKGAATTAPNAADVATLRADTKTAQANTGGPTAAQTAQVQADQDAISESEGVNVLLVTKLDADQAAVKTASGVTAFDTTTLAADQAAVTAAEAKLKADTPTPPTTTATGSTTASTTNQPNMPATSPATPTDFSPAGRGFGRGGFTPWE